MHLYIVMIHLSLGPIIYHTGIMLIILLQMYMSTGQRVLLIIHKASISQSNRQTQSNTVLQYNSFYLSNSPKKPVEGDNANLATDCLICCFGLN